VTLFYEQQHHIQIVLLFAITLYTLFLYRERKRRECYQSPVVLHHHIMTPGSYHNNNNNNNNKAIEPLRDLLGDVLLRLEALESKVGIASTGGGGSSSTTTTTTTTTTPSSSLSTGESFFFCPQCIIIYVLGISIFVSW
jgi:hypothetical protein